MNTKKVALQFLVLIVFMAASSACAGKQEGPSISRSSQEQLRDTARRSLESLYATTPSAKELRAQSKAILVFPDVLKAGLIVGGSGGNGVLFSPGGKVLGYYNVASLSFGLQAGAQEFAQAMFLTAPEALKYLDNSSGWSVGVGPSVVVVDQGMAKDFSTTTVRSDVYAFIYGQTGLMGGLGVEGQKITKLRNY